MFSPQGMLAIMFLKSYCNCSDRKLIESLNGNIEFQLLCGIFLGTERIDNYKVVSHIRTEVSKKLNIQGIQKVLAEAWKPYISQSNIMLEDATCHETPCVIRPTLNCFGSVCYGLMVSLGYYASY